MQAHASTLQAHCKQNASKYEEKHAENDEVDGEEQAETGLGYKTVIYHQAFE